MTTSPKGPAQRGPGEPISLETLKAASDKLVRLRDRPDDVEMIDEIRRWRAESALNDRAWRKVQRTWDEIGDKGQPALRGTDHPTRLAEAHPKHVPFHRRRASVVTALALSVLVIFFGNWLALDGPARLMADHVTGTGETRQVRLADGSRLHLGAESLVRVLYTEDERRVVLLAGEAFFEVTSDPGRPFHVDADPASVEAIGTAFDVRHGSDGPSAGVAKGIVRVTDRRRPDAVLTLDAGRQARLAPDAAPTVRAIPPEDVAPWRRERLIARDEPVGDVVADLERYLGGVVLFATPSLADQRVSGIYDIADPDRALVAVLSPFGGRAISVTSFLTIIY